jgi:regulator of sirC expression with transglutaminase-like and TPR domain
MDPTARFTELVQLPEADIPLDETLFLVAAHDHALDVDAQCARLDELATHCPHDADALASHLFGELGFRGNDDDYGDPRNSYLDLVLDRRLGIPITLSVVMLEVGRRAGVALDGIGMPGHFLVGAGGSRYYDPFHGGRPLDVDDARSLHRAVRGDAPFRSDSLAPVGTRAILARVLANLLHTFVERAPASAVWVARLRLRIPGLTPAERREVAALLGSLGRFAEAATELEAIVPQLDDDDAARIARDAAALRARAN